MSNICFIKETITEKIVAEHFLDINRYQALDSKYTKTTWCIQKENYTQGHHSQITNNQRQSEIFKDSQKEKKEVQEGQLQDQTVYESF